MPAPWLKQCALWSELTFRQRATSSHVVFTDGICYAASQDNFAHVLHSKANGFATGFNTSHVRIKGSLTRDFLPQVFFVNQCPPGPLVCHWDRFDFFRKFAEIIANVCCSAVSTTPAIKEKKVFRYNFFSFFVKSL